MVRKSGNNSVPQSFSTVKEFFAEETIDKSDSDSVNDTESFLSVETDPDQTFYSLRTKSTISSRKYNEHKLKKKLAPSSLILKHDPTGLHSKAVTEKNMSTKGETVQQEQQSLNNTKKLNNSEINKSLKIQQKSKLKSNVNKTKEISDKQKPPSASNYLPSIMEAENVHEQNNEHRVITSSINKVSKKTVKEQKNKSKNNAASETQEVDSRQQSSIRGSSIEPSIDKINIEEKNTRKEKEHTRKQKTPKRKSNIISNIIKLQSGTDFLIPKLSFSRLIREILISFAFDRNYLRISMEALLALQESAEMYLTQLFQDSYLCTTHRGRITLQVKDMKLVQSLRQL